jgi:hypothetical protein
MTSMTMMLAKKAAFRKVADQYGLSDDVMQSIGVVARSPEKERATDPRMERIRLDSDIGSAFQSNSQMDRVVPSHMPEPSAINRHVG